mmetsp:Transcript_37355/g.95422  ORF Transcript_37355/g.95422 Transcript_37355/m.95422 type:complete len:283 (+) Transcript_37355:354-1202(+)
MGDERADDRRLRRPRGHRHRLRAPDPLGGGGDARGRCRHRRVQHHVVPLPQLLWKISPRALRGLPRGSHLRLLRPRVRRLPPGPCPIGRGHRRPRRPEGQRGDSDGTARRGRDASQPLPPVCPGAVPPRPQGAPLGRVRVHVHERRDLRRASDVICGQPERDAGGGVVVCAPLVRGEGDGLPRGDRPVRRGVARRGVHRGGAADGVSAPLPDPGVQGEPAVGHRAPRLGAEQHHHGNVRGAVCHGGLCPAVLPPLGPESPLPVAGSPPLPRRRAHLGRPGGQ